MGKFIDRVGDFFTKVCKFAFIGGGIIGICQLIKNEIKDS